ncbi:histidinol-phosphate transaminase [Helicobacter didelphidarum]|uniref:Histidinol-phosphate aminotransferase n=1 Tax=Helicobacter didelphidarum TaxID=2040648 RepID=A0A3D8IQU3_9HELI|nr:histidinol-phosphate transaminase [Helicobacter didelphidarum]RDU66981.1 histidinol-phosphate transaminase [Helicobacter didelphidarum]
MKFHQYIHDLPTYEVGKPLELVMREYGIQPDRIIKLGSNENPLGVSPSAKQVLMESASLASIYPDDSYHELKNSLSDLYGIQPSNIIIGSGSDQIIEFCVHAICDNTTKILMAKTTFAMYEIYAKHFGAKVIRTKDFLHNLDSMLSLYKKHKPSMIFLCTPNNPLGEALPKKEVMDFITQIDKECCIVLDCAYMEYCRYKNEEYAIYPKDIINFPNVIYLGTFSKIYGLGGMRIGYGIAHEKTISMLHKLRPPFNITTLSLKAATASLKDKDFLEQTLANNFTEMQRYISFAKQKSLQILESYANFITFLLHNKLNSTKIGILLLQEGIVVRNLESYGLNALRITIGTPEQNQIVLEKLSTIIEK